MEVEFDRWSVSCCGLGRDGDVAGDVGRTPAVEPLSDDEDDGREAEASVASELLLLQPEQGRRRRNGRR